MKINSKLILSIAFLFVSGNMYVSATQQKENYDFDEQTKNFDFDNDCDDCILRVKALLAKRVKTKCLDAHRANIQEASIDKLCAEHVRSKDICTETLGVNGTANINSINTLTLNAIDLCLTGTVSYSELCSRYKAFVRFGADSSYTLGTNVNFDTIINDPNNNVSLAPFAYTVPVNGYYMVTVQIDQDGLDTPSPVLGAPVGVVSINVNGTQNRSSIFPYLTFSSVQHNTYSALLFLDQGDIVQVSFNVNALSDAGFVDLPGTVNMIGGVHQSLFLVHYLSSACGPKCTPPPPYAPCATECTTKPCAASCIDRLIQ